MQDQDQLWPFNLEPNLDFEYTYVQVGNRYQIGNFNTMLAALTSTIATA